MRRSNLMRLLLLLAMTAAPGCVRHALNPLYEQPLARPAAVRDAFRYEPMSFGAAETERRQETTTLVIDRTTLPADSGRDDESDLTIDFFHQPNAMRQPLILVLPILGGDNEIAEMFARAFARRGMAAAVVHRQDSYKDTDDLDELNRVFHRIVIDHMRALDWLETRPTIDPQRIGLFGVSAGAIKGSLVYALDDRVRAAVLALGGGDLPLIYTRSKHHHFVDQREAVLREHETTRDELYEVMRAEFEHDPLRYAAYADARSALLILGRFDAIVPFEAGQRLRRAMGGPETIILPAGHYTSIVFFPFAQSRAARFFEQHLAPDSETHVDRSRDE